MKTNKAAIVLIFTLISSFTVWSQDDKVFHFSDYIDSVLKHHPMAVQAQLVDQIGEAKQLKARGAFDPKASANMGQKYFDDKKYYSVIDAGFKFPTWLGIDLKAGYEQNIGVNVNPELSTPNSGLVYAGVSIPIGKGLFIDQRRVELKKANIFIESSDTQQKMMLNELLYNASNAYWDWYNSYNSMFVFEEAYNTALQRFDAVKKEAFLGDRPFVDTLEAGIQVQNRLISYQEAQLNYQNASAQLSVYMWLDGQVPIEVTDAIHPVRVENSMPVQFDDSYTPIIDTLISQHPELLMYDFKLQELDVDRKWAVEQLKPELNLRYNPITEATSDGFGNDLSINNYKWGVNFSMPLVLRKERGELQLTKVKITETKLDQVNKSEILRFKAVSALNSWRTTFNQLSVYRNTVKDYRKLFESEVQLFNNGESNLFMVNSREVGLINTQIKLIDLVTKNHKAEMKAKYHLGILVDENR